MASNYWAKLWIEMLYDRKTASLPDNLWRRFSECILMAKELNDGGRLPSVEDMSWIVRVEVETIEQELDALARRGMIDYRADNPLNGHWFVTNFKKRQEGMSGAERVRRHRETEKKRMYNDTGNAAVTYRYTEEEEEAEKEKEAEEEVFPPTSSFSPTFSQESIQEGQARRLLESICGVMTKDAIGYYGTVEDLISKFGYDETKSAIVKSRDKWVSTPRKNGNGHYSPTNYGFIDWAVADLQGVRALNSYEKLILELGGSLDE